MVLTEKFGRISFLEMLSGSINNCSWTFESPFTENIALIVRFEAFSSSSRRPPSRGGSGGRPPPGRGFGRGDSFGRPNGQRGRSSTRLVFPGGDVATESQLPFIHDGVCRRYYADASSSACTEAVLNQYCNFGQTFVTTLWPPVITSVIDPNDFFTPNFDLTLYYVLAICQTTERTSVLSATTPTLTHTTATTIAAANVSSTTATIDSLNTIAVTSTTTTTTTPTTSATNAATVTTQGGRKNDGISDSSSDNIFGNLCIAKSTSKSNVLMPIFGAFSGMLFIILVIVITVMNHKLRVARRQNTYELPKLVSAFDQMTYLRPVDTEKTALHPHHLRRTLPDPEAKDAHARDYEEIIPRDVYIQMDKLRAGHL